MKYFLPTLFLWGLFMVPLSGPGVLAADGMTADYLRVEYRVDPQGIDIVKPRLSWVVRSRERGQKQSAYRVLVASHLEGLQTDRGDLWDSGKVASDETVAVVYNGAALGSGVRAYGKVMVWDQAGRPSPWSAPATWSMGLLTAGDWQAQWIGLDRVLADTGAADRSQPLAQAFANAHWIWVPDGDPVTQAAVGTAYFRRTFVLPGDQAVQSAELAIAADNQAAVFVNGCKLGTSSDHTAGRWFDLAGRLRPGVNTVAVAVANVGDAPNPAGLMCAIRAVPVGGPPLVVTTDAQWLATTREQDVWQAPDHDTAAWSVAKPLGANGVAPWGAVKVGTLRLPPPRYLRTEFALSKPVRRATIYGSALGLYELHVNGQKVGNDFFAPGWTDYDKRVYYDTYDVTDLVTEGSNAIGAVLADGWYAGYVGFGGGRDLYGDKVRLLAQLDVQYTDGTTQTFASGPDWRATTGPLVEADFLMGEAYDARREMPGWDTCGFDASGWHAVDVTGAIPAKVQARPGPAVQPLAPIRPVAIREVQTGRFVVDMGQNFAGVVRLQAKATAGQAITLRYAEMVNPDGTVYTDNLRSARATDTYICRGDDKAEVWQPRFTFHGFQYVELTGYPGTPTADDVIGIPLSSNTPVVGHFECSDKMVNQLMRNIYWTQRMNFIDIPTDCPQRDERLGWTGDAQIYVRTASMIADTQAFFTKWLVDLEDAQRADGQFPMVAPLKSKGVTADGGPAWADAGVICPWTIYEMYGDRQLLARHYPSMTRFIAFCRDRCTEAMLPPEEFHCFGDWLSIKADTPKDVIYTAYFAHSTRLVARAAKVLGKQQDAAQYEELFQRIRAAFNQAYVAPDGRIKGDTQTCYVLALAFDLLDEEKQALAASYLVADIESRDGHLSTGFIGTKDLMLVLTKIGRTDIAYRLLANTTFPSWGFSIRHGATSIWERWNGWTPADGFFDPGMNSFAHYSFGAVAQWIFETVGGIHTDGPGFQKIVIHPRPGGELTWATTSYRSIRGEIRTAWKHAGDAVQLKVTIPANTTATVFVPSRAGSPVTESGKPADQAPGVRLLGRTEAAAVFAVGSGEYSFTSTMPATSAAVPLRSSTGDSPRDKVPNKRSG